MTITFKAEIVISLYDWIKKYGKGMEHYEQQKQDQDEIRRLKAEFKRVTMARHPKKGRRVLCQGARVKYEFIRAHKVA